MKINFSQKSILLISAFVLVVLSGIFLFVWGFVDISAEQQQFFTLGLGLLSAALVTVVTYQSMKIYESASELAEDITEDILNYSHELFTELYRSSPVPYVVIDQEGLVVSMNLATARLFHTEINALEGLNIFSFFENDETQKAALVPEYFKEGKSLSDVELQLNRPDAKKRWVMLSLFSFKDSERQKRGLVTLVDVTKQKLIDKAKTEFVSLASHQLRTPISGMKWNVELLLTAGKGVFDEAQKKYIGKISGGIERMEMLINDFLSASKFELGTLEPEYTDVPIPEFMHKVQDELTLTAQEKGVRLEVNITPGRDSIRSDAHMLHNIVSNLMSNAIKYTPTNGVVKVDVNQDTNAITFKIRDTGIGIPLKDQEMIFSKMFRASNARTKVTDGTGLGLYIVKGSVDMLGGHISFLSEEGKGTEFTVVLPTE